MTKPLSYPKPHFFRTNILVSLIVIPSISSDFHQQYLSIYHNISMNYRLENIFILTFIWEVLFLLT